MIAIALAAAALPSILGLRLGSPIPLPECARMALRYPEPDGSPPPYLSAQSRECIQHGAAASSSIDNGVIYFPPEAMNSIMGFNMVGFGSIGGRLASLGIPTLDYNHADFIIGQLSAKFGAPDSDQPAQEDLDTIGVPSRLVEWRRPGYRIEYRSINHHIESGLILIQTDEAAAADELEQKRRQAGQTPL